MEMEDTARNRRHAAPLRPSAAAAARTHPAAAAGPFSSDAGLSWYFLHGAFYGLGSNAKRFADCFYHPATTNAAEQLRFPVRDYNRDVIDDDRLMPNTMSNWGHGSIPGGSALHGDPSRGATADAFVFHGDPRRSAAGRSHGDAHDDVMVDSTDSDPPNFTPNYGIWPDYGGEPHHGFFAPGHVHDAIGDAGYETDTTGYETDTTGYETDTTGDGFVVLLGGYKLGTIGNGSVLLEEPRRGDVEYEDNIIGDAGYEDDTTGDGIVLPGGYELGTVGDGSVLLGEPSRGDAGHETDITGDDFLLLGGYEHNTIGDDFVLVGEARRGDAGYEDDIIGDGFVLLEEPRCGDAIYGSHDATGDDFVVLGEPRRSGAVHAHDAVGDGAAAGDVQDANCAASCTVQSVWRDNCEEAFAGVLDMLRRPHHHLYIALDLEFVADASTDVHFRPFTWDQWYHHLHAFVNGGDVVQVGLALAFDIEHHHGGPLSPVIALEINLEFDEAAHRYNDASISFLAKQGHCLAEHRNRGVPVKEFLDGLLCHLVSGHDKPITWIMYHGDNDLGFLIRLLQEQPGRERGALPPDRATFMREVRRQFPNFYDLRVLGQLVKEGFRGKFSVLADTLGVERVGLEHHAGSDAVLTMSCFSEILRRSQHELHRLESRKCLLSGMEDLNMAIKCARRLDAVDVQTVPVRQAEFDEQARWIEELVTSNFKIVGVDVSLPPSGWDSSLWSAAEPKECDLMKSRLEGIGECQVVLGFMNADGMVALGRVWKFYLRIDPAGGKNDCVDPGRLARLLESCGATHNPDVVWVTYQGLEGIACLIKSSMAAGHLPSDWCSCNEHRRAHFPGMYDVGLIAQGWPDTGVLPTWCRGTLYDIARNLKVIKDDDTHPVEKVLLVLGCYKRLKESPHFSLIASGVRGQLMAGRSRAADTT